MGIKRVLSSVALCVTLGLIGVFFAIAQEQRQATAPAAPAPLYNTVKQKLIEGKQVFGGTLTTGDTAAAQKMAASGYDFLWIEMQHSPMTYETAAKIIEACKGLPAIPFLRVPDATESDIQKATDIGALGIIVPMVEAPEKAQAAVKFAKFPPVGRRSTGSMPAPSIWGKDYRQTANENMMVVAMIETPEGVKNASKIAEVPGIDIVFAASSDLSYFSASKQGEPFYESLVTQIRDATLKAGKLLGGPGAWAAREGFKFFQGRPSPGRGKVGS